MGRPFDIPAALPLEAQNGETYDRVVALMRRLLAEDGCPWDKEQTIQSLRPYTLEEACEVMDAIESGDMHSLCDELGDLAFQVVFLAELAQREGHFGPDDVFRAIITKLVRRHPHVFDTGSLESSDQVASQWEVIKAEEKKHRPLLDNIPRSLPALEGARRMSERVASVGFDWKDETGSRAKVHEELTELDEAVASGDRAEIEHELGDLLFAVVNLARHLDIDPEKALAKTSSRFRTRFGHVERRVKETRGDWPREKTKATRGVPVEEMEEFWREAKQLEKTEKLALAAKEKAAKENAHD